MFEILFKIPFLQRTSRNGPISCLLLRYKAYLIAALRAHKGMHCRLICGSQEGNIRFFFLLSHTPPIVLSLSLGLWETCYTVRYLPVEFKNLDGIVNYQLFFLSLWLRSRIANTVVILLHLITHLFLSSIMTNKSLQVIPRDNSEIFRLSTSLTFH